MTRELAKQLKDAGFPLVKLLKDCAHEQHGRYFCVMCGYPFIEIDGELYLVPVLNVLIEACGDKIFELMYFLPNKHGPAEWRATARWITHGEGSSTPEEAVAKLWLALNVKP